MHLLIFILFTSLLVLFPVISVPKKGGSILLREFKFPKKVNLKVKKLVPSLFYFFKVFDYMFENNFGVRFLWTAGFMSWILGCWFWVIHIDSVSLAFILTSIIFCLVSIYTISDLNLNEVPNQSGTKVGFSVYVLIISLSVFFMVATKTVANGVTLLLVLLVCLRGWRIIQKTKETDARAT